MYICLRCNLPHFETKIFDSHGICCWLCGCLAFDIHGLMAFVFVVLLAAVHFWLWSLGFLGLRLLAFLNCFAVFGLVLLGVVVLWERTMRKNQWKKEKERNKNNQLPTIRTTLEQEDEHNCTVQLNAWGGSGRRCILPCHAICTVPKDRSQQIMFCGGHNHHAKATATATTTATATPPTAVATRK